MLPAVVRETEHNITFLRRVKKNSTIRLIVPKGTRTYHISSVPIILVVCAVPLGTRVILVLCGVCPRTASRLTRGLHLFIDLPCLTGGRVESQINSCFWLFSLERRRLRDTADHGSVLGNSFYCVGGRGPFENYPHPLPR